MIANRNTAAMLAEAFAKGVLRSRDLEAQNYSRAQLSRWVADGTLVRVARGLYALPDREVHEHEAIVHAAARVDGAIICLLSALRLHRLTTQNPPDVWIALPRGARTPRLDWPPLHVVRWSGIALSEGVIEKRFTGVSVRLTTPARTVADCFKHRSSVGIDVAIEALRDYRRTRSGSIDELMDAAKVCRVHRVMQPYVEAIT